MKICFALLTTGTSLHFNLVQKLHIDRKATAISVSSSCAKTGIAFFQTEVKAMTVACEITTPQLNKLLGSCNIKYCVKKAITITNNLIYVISLRFERLLWSVWYTLTLLKFNNW